MSVFAQYVPYNFARGTWDERRDEVRALAMKSLGRFCSNLDTAVIDAQVLGPPDIEQKVGLSGGLIFQGGSAYYLRIYVVQSPLRANSDAGPVSLRSGHAPRWQRDWNKRTQCCDGGAEGPGKKFKAGNLAAFLRARLCYAAPYMAELPALKRGTAVSRPGAALCSDCSNRALDGKRGHSGSQHSAHLGGCPHLLLHSI